MHRLPRAPIALAATLGVALSMSGPAPAQEPAADAPTAKPVAAPAAAPTAAPVPEQPRGATPAPAAPTLKQPRAAAPGPGAPTPPAAPAEAAPQEAPSPESAEDTARRAEVLAKFEGGSVTVGDLEDAIEAQSPFMRRRYARPENRKALLDKLVRFELLAREAERRNYDDDPVVVQAVKQNAVQQLMKVEFDDKITAGSVPAEDVKAYYEEHLHEFVRPATRRASHVLVATEEEAKALIEEATGLDMRAFRQLAREKSLDEETKLRGGDMRYFDAEGRLKGEDMARMPKDLTDAVFALENVGDVAKTPVKMLGGYSVVKLTGMRPENRRTLEQADETIRARLWRERRQGAIDDYVAKLRAEHKPEVHPELVGAIRFDQAEVAKTSSIPSGFPADKATKGGEH